MRLLSFIRSFYSSSPLPFTILAHAVAFALAVAVTSMYLQPGLLYAVVILVIFLLILVPSWQLSAMLALPVINFLLGFDIIDSIVNRKFYRNRHWVPINKRPVPFRGKE